MLVTHSLSQNNNLKKIVKQILQYFDMVRGCQKFRVCIDMHMGIYHLYIPVRTVNSRLRQTPLM